MTEKIDRPITGDIQRSHRADVTQVSAEQFLADVDKILAYPGVLAVGWSQYTPYFNDGETCEFGINEVALKLDPEVFGQVEDDDAYDLPDDENWVTSYGLKTVIDDTLDYRQRYADSNYRYEINGVDTNYLKEAFKVWKGAAYENVALDNFGDHATVVATTEGFSVEFNEHE